MIAECDITRYESLDGAGMVRMVSGPAAITVAPGDLGWNAEDLELAVAALAAAGLAGDHYDVLSWAITKVYAESRADEKAGKEETSGTQVG